MLLDVEGKLYKKIIFYIVLKEICLPLIIYSIASAFLWWLEQLSKVLITLPLYLRIFQKCMA